MPYTTSRRMFLLSTPLGEDVLLIQQFEGSEGVSRLFEFRLLMVAEDDNIAAEDLIGKRVTLRIETPEGERFWLGMVSSFERVGRAFDPGASETELTSYHCEVVPWLWFMSLQKDTRIFQNLSVPDIIETLLGEFQFSDYALDLKGSHPQRIYCTQYNETDLAFISRLIEEEGIFYYFKHPDDGHGAEQVIFTDHKDGHPALDPDTIRMDQPGSVDEQDTVATLLHRQHMRSGKVTLRDFTFERPSDRMEVSIDSLVRIGDNASYEVYDYPGTYASRFDGVSRKDSEQQARLIMEIEEARHEILDGESNVRALVPGHRFTLTEHSQDALNEEYVITAVQHSGTNNLSRDGGPSRYNNRFSCIPSRVQYREPRRTPRPRVAGVQSAIVTGPAGEEIYTDEFGRVKVQFHWDRLGQYDDKSSCWVRVAQMHAGGKWGGFMLPRIGEEVLMAFEHGDPDRPYVIGSLYNGDNMPPYPLPAEATKSTLKTRSCKGGDGFNEIRFEDNKGSEQLFVRAERDHETRIKHDSLEWIGNDRHLIVKGDQLQQFDGDTHLTVSGDHNENVKGTSSLKADIDIQQKAGIKHALEAGTEIHLKAGVNLVIEAGATLTLKVGANFINLNPGGVFIQGTMLMLNSGGGAGSGSGSSPAPPKPPREADQADPGEATTYAGTTAPRTAPSPQATTLIEAAKAGTPFCEKCEAARKAREAQQA